MKVSATYSHINGLEYLRVRRPELWSELEDVISEANAADCKVEVGTDTLAQESAKYSAKQLRGQFCKLFQNQYLRQSLTSRTRLWLVNSAESGNLVEEKLK